MLFMKAYSILSKTIFVAASESQYYTSCMDGCSLDSDSLEDRFFQSLLIKGVQLISWTDRRRVQSGPKGKYN
jgi:hypothetical protein